MRPDENDRRRRARHRPGSLDRVAAAEVGPLLRDAVQRVAQDARSSASSSGDTQLPDTAQAIQVAERFASNSAILGVVGPAGSQEVQVSTAPLRSGRLAFVSGSATRTSLTTDGTRRGYFFRVVPNDDQQGPRVANYIRQTLRHARVVGRRRAELVQHRAGRQRAGQPARRRRHGRTRVGERGRHDRLLVARGPDPCEHAVGLHPVAAGPEGAALRPAAPRRGQAGDPVRLGRALRPGQLQDPGLVCVVLPDPAEQPDHRGVPPRAGQGLSPSSSACRATRQPTSSGGRSTRRAPTARPLAPRSGASSTPPTSRRPSRSSVSGSGSSSAVAACSAPATWRPRRTSGSIGSTTTACTSASPSETST